MFPKQFKTSPFSTVFHLAYMLNYVDLTRLNVFIIVEHMAKDRWRCIFCLWVTCCPPKWNRWNNEHVPSFTKRAERDRVLDTVGWSPWRKSSPAGRPQPTASPALMAQILSASAILAVHFPFSWKEPVYRRYESTSDNFLYVIDTLQHTFPPLPPPKGFTLLLRGKGECTAELLLCLLWQFVSV